MDITILNESEPEKLLDNRELKKVCFDYAKSNFQGKRFYNRNTQREILVSRDGLDEWQSKSKSREQILSIKKLDELIEGAVFLDTRNDTENRYAINEFVYLSKRIDINEKPFEAILTIRNTKQGGDKYYHHYLKDINLEPLSGNRHTSGNPAGNAPLLSGSGRNQENSLEPDTPSSTTSPEKSTHPSSMEELFQLRVKGVDEDAGDAARTAMSSIQKKPSTRKPGRGH